MIIFKFFKKNARISKSGLADFIKIRVPSTTLVEIALRFLCKGEKHQECAHQECLII
jgi:hypothetical protein